MTLHSTAFAYPEQPTQSERDLMYSWLDMFRDTITCPTCKDHFFKLLASYRSQFPNMLSNRHEFIMFTFRAHNAVNRRINKPIYSSVDDCLAVLRNAVSTRTAREFRHAYLAHIARHWRILQDITGIVALKKIQEMKRIDTEYITSRDNNFTIAVRQDTAVLPQAVMDRTTETQVRRPVFTANANVSTGFRITSTGFRLRR